MNLIAFFQTYLPLYLPLIITVIGWFILSRDNFSFFVKKNKHETLQKYREQAFEKIQGLLFEAAFQTRKYSFELLTLDLQLNSISLLYSSHGRSSRKYSTDSYLTFTEIHNSLTEKIDGVIEAYNGYEIFLPSLSSRVKELEKTKTDFSNQHVKLAAKLLFYPTSEAENDVRKDAKTVLIEISEKMKEEALGLDKKIDLFRVELQNFVFSKIADRKLKAN